MKMRLSGSVASRFLLTGALSLLLPLASKCADVPWVFEGSTNRVPASSDGVSVQNLVRCEFSSAQTVPTELLVRTGCVIIVR